jgi:small subunit ribosomal protein S18
MRTKKPTRRSGMFLPAKKKVCRFCTDKVSTIDYKDVKTLESFIKERGRILSARTSGNCAKHQRQLTRAIKQSRFISLVSYVRI